MSKTEFTVKVTEKEEIVEALSKFPDIKVDFSGIELETGYHKFYLRAKREILIEFFRHINKLERLLDKYIIVFGSLYNLDSTYNRFIGGYSMDTFDFYIEEDPLRKYHI